MTVAVLMKIPLVYIVQEKVSDTKKSETNNTKSSTKKSEKQIHTDLRNNYIDSENTNNNYKNGNGMSNGNGNGNGSNSIIIDT